MKIENWVTFPKPVILPITSQELYSAYNMNLPPLDLIDEKMQIRLGKYLLSKDEKFDYAHYQQKYVIMYVSISPKLKEGWTKEYGLFRAALEIAAEESTGTWDPDLKTLLPEELDECSQANMKVLEAKVIGLNFETGMAAIALPTEGFELGNIPQMLSVVVGNYTGMGGALWGVRLEDLDFPDDYANSFIGPSVGNSGIKKLLGDNITVGTIVKPKTGLSAEDWAKTAYRSFLHGLDVVKDDENLTNQSYCLFEERAKLVLQKIKEVQQITGRNYVYVPNITSGYFEDMVARAELIHDLGGNCLMIDVLAAGFATVQTIRRKFPKMILHGHRAGHGAQTIHPEPIINGQKIEFRHGVSMKVWTLIARLAGIDQFHIGAPKGKMEATSRTVLENLEACTRPLGHLKKCRPICSGGLKATVLWDVAKIMNPEGSQPNIDIICQAGGGTHSHDLGTVGGSKSMVQTRDAIQAGMSINGAISNHFEVLLAFRKWDHAIYVNWLQNLKIADMVVVEPDLTPYIGPQKEQKGLPQPRSLQNAFSIYPPLKEDVRKYAPHLLEQMNSK